MRQLLSILKRSSWYWKAKYSPLGQYILRRIHPQLSANQKQEAYLYQEAICTQKKEFLVFDIGANVGNNTQLFLDMGAKVIALEPDKTNFICLQSRFAQNQDVQLLQKAVSNQVGSSRLFLQKDGSSLHTLSNEWKDFLEDNDRWEYNVEFSHSVQVKTTTLKQLILEYGKPDFIKIDVEGFEEEVIQSLDQPIKQLCFEANLPQFSKQTVRCIQFLQKISKNASFNYSTEDRLILSEYILPDEMIRIVLNTTTRYMDIFCKMK